MVKDAYNFNLLKQKRIERGISILDMANKLCLAERQILSIEENRSEHFPSPILKLVCVRRYAKALELDIYDVIPNIEQFLKD
jgi:cytoskeletal protein RodZ